MVVQLYRKGHRSGDPVAEGDAYGIFSLLAMWGTADLYEVYNGEEYLDARKFAERFGGHLQPADGFKTPEERMYFEGLNDPNIHARNEMVRRHIAEAIRLSQEPNYMPDQVAKNTAHDIIMLFY